METEEKTITILPNDSSGYITSNNNTLGNYVYHTGINTGGLHTAGSIGDAATVWNSNPCELVIYGDIYNVKTEEDLEVLMSKLTDLENKVKARLEAIKGKKVKRRKLDI